jgi:CheY-like chemotaxis protein/xanthosine utilization system XapX-like protein
MGKVTGKNLNGEIDHTALRGITMWSYGAISGLIIGIILVMVNLRFFAGLVLIITAAAGILLTKKIISFLTVTRNSLKEISSSNEKKDNVITNFSHKIREPLNNVVIIADMMMESGLQKKQKELLETFVASTNNMVTTVNELTMQSADNISLEPRKYIRFNLLSTIQNTIELYSLKDKVNIDFILNTREFTDFECFGDPISVKRILLDIFNTIENSNSEKETKVTIGLRKEKEGVNEILVSLRIQIDKVIVLINEKEPKKSLAARLISARKGSVAQEFGANYTVLDIQLPFTNIIRESKIPTASPRIGELMQKEKVHKELKDIKILLVEDNLINQKITLLTLQPLVNSIDTATNGKEALDKFGTSNFDIILMDIQMPVMSGLLAAEKIRALESSTSTHIPIIAITANAMLGDREKCISAGIDDYISKPFQPSALIDKIKKYI